MPTPFAHEELELKKYFVGLARQYYQALVDTQDEDDPDSNGGIQKELATALLYMNVADYLAEYMVVGLNEMARIAMSKYYLGTVSFMPPKKDKLNLERSINQLTRYDFPKKNEILAELNAIKADRNKIAHQMLKTESRHLKQIDRAVRSLVQHTEVLVELVDEISLGLPPRTLLDRFDEVSQQQDTPAAD